MQWQKSLRSTSPWLIINPGDRLQKVAMRAYGKTVLSACKDQKSSKKLQTSRERERVDVYRDREYVTRAEGGPKKFARPIDFWWQDDLKSDALSSYSSSSSSSSGSIVFPDLESDTSCEERVREIWWYSDMWWISYTHLQNTMQRVIWWIFAHCTSREQFIPPSPWLTFC